MRITQAYRIWFSQRNGSSLLCKGLEQTGIAGRPGEYFTYPQDTSFADHHGQHTWLALRDHLWQIGSTDNGVFGVKHSWTKRDHGRLLAEIKQLKGLTANEPIASEDLLADLFPNCKHIFLTRRNKVRQAVSWWKAIKGNVWHLPPCTSQQDTPSFYDENYDFDALHHLFRETVLRECSIQAYFTANGIVPFTLVYEDFIQNYPGTLRQVIDYLGIKYDELNLPTAPYYQPTATELSEQWVQRFRQDLQEQMGCETW